MSNEHTPGEPSSQWPPGEPPPPQRKSRKGKIIGFGCLGLTVLIILIVVLSLAVGGGGNGGEESPAEEGTTSPSPTAEETGKSYGDGDHVVGEDIPPGTYESAGAKDDVFELCTITTEPTGPNTLPQAKSAERGERIVITLAEEDGTVTVQGCEPLTPR